jgi:hypothetical protein
LEFLFALIGKSIFVTLLRADQTRSVQTLLGDQKLLSNDYKVSSLGRSISILAIPFQYTSSVAFNHLRCPLNRWPYALTSFALFDLVGVYIAHVGYVLCHPSSTASSLGSDFL